MLPSPGDGEPRHSTSRPYPPPEQAAGAAEGVPGGQEGCWHPRRVERLTNAKTGAMLPMHILPLWEGAQSGGSREAPLEVGPAQLAILARHAARSSFRRPFHYPPPLPAAPPSSGSLSLFFSAPAHRFSPPATPPPGGNTQLVRNQPVMVLSGIIFGGGGYAAARVDCTRDKALSALHP